MRRFETIALIEIRRLYRHPLPWAVLALTLLLMAVLFMLLVIRYLNDETVLRNAGVTVEILARYFGSGAMLILLLAPLLTMTSMGAERNEAGLRFLFTLPISSLDIVSAKLLSLFSLGAALWFLMALIPLTLLWGAAIDLGVYASCSLGLALFIMLHLGIGLLASCLTLQPILAGTIALSFSLTLWFADWANRLDPDSTILGGLSSASRLRGFTVGLVNTGDIVYFIAGIFVCVALGAWRLDGLRRYS